MFRAVVAGVVTMTASMFGAGLGLWNQAEPHPPHVRLADRASTIAQMPGSDLDGIRIALAPAAYVGWIREFRTLQVVVAVQLAAEIAVAVEPPASPPEQAVTADSSESVSQDGWSEWDWQAACETGGDWSMQGSSYSGGLGFANGSWDAYGGQEFAPNAGQATREEQILVAERIQDTPPVNGPGIECQGW